MALFTGYSTNGVPYAKLSDNGRVLVVFTGSKLDHQPPTKTAQQGFYLGLKRLTRSYSIYPKLLKSKFSSFCTTRLCYCEEDERPPALTKGKRS